MARSDLSKRLHLLSQKQDWEIENSPKLIEFFIEILPLALKVERCSIFVQVPDEDYIWLYRGTGVERKRINVPKDNSIVGEVIATGRFQARYRLNDTEGLHTAIDAQTGFVTRDILCVPIRAVTEDKVTGAIQLLNKLDQSRYSDYDRSVAEKAAFHIQMHIENMHLNREIKTLL